jgi:short-subunit dehydrogenase
MSDALWRELMLIGIDVVIIKPGTVNTAMYHKGEKEDLRGKDRRDVFLAHSRS